MLSSLGFVYRFLFVQQSSGRYKADALYRTTGTVEEKIFQRQAHKQALSASVVDAKADEMRHFSVGDLKKLFLCKSRFVFVEAILIP